MVHATQEEIESEIQKGMRAGQSFTVHVHARCQCYYVDLEWRIGSDGWGEMK